MSTHIDTYNLSYEGYPDRGAGARFARLDVTVETQVNGGYWGDETKKGDIALYIHEDSGIVTADRDEFLRWTRSLMTKQYRDEENTDAP